MNELPLQLRRRGIKWLEQVPSFNLFDTQLADADFVGTTLPVSLRVKGVSKGIAHFEISEDHVTAVSVILGTREPLRVSRKVGLHFHALPHGGRRAAMVCPHCESRATTLYCLGFVFCCRRCVGLPYRSTSVAPLDRYSLIAARYRQELALERYQPVEQARRPRYMRKSRFEHLKREIRRRERRIETSAMLRWRRRR